MQQRHKKKPTLITSNLGFGEWRSFLKDAVDWLGQHFGGQFPPSWQAPLPLP